MNKKDNFRIGQLGEEIAAQYLTDKGYKVLARNYRTSLGEIDIIATYGTYLVMVEVKAKKHSYFGSPEEMVDDRKIHRILSAADVVMANFDQGSATVRLDVVAIDLDYRDQVMEIRHYEAYDQ